MPGGTGNGTVDTPPPGAGSADDDEDNPFIQPSLGASVLRIAYGGATWVVTPLSIAILMAGLAAPLGQPMLVPLSAVPFFLFLLLWFFFRDPERRTADGVACPADGRVVRIDQVDDPDLGRCERLSIFMRPSDVHVNRFPLDGNIRSVTHHPGKHMPAFHKDSERNERVVTVMKTEVGEIKIIQIAGAVARRIVPYAEKGDTVLKGERLGLIRLGSRCDLLVPEGSVRWNCKVGDRVYAGLRQVGEVQ